MNRIDRISAILIQLQSRKVVKAQSIADRFQISLRTVYRDISTLQEAGVPIIGEAGIGYSIADGYRLPPVMFTLHEATAFLTAGKLIDKFTDKKTATHYETALLKIKAILRSTEKDYLENIEEQIAVRHNPWLPVPDAGNDYMQELLSSIAHQLVVTIQYHSPGKNEKSSRDIEPVGLFFQSGSWYLIAYCRLREDYRNFRLDRIQQLVNTDKPFRKKHPSLKTYLSQLSRQEKDLQQIVISVPKNMTRYMGDQKYYLGYVSEKEAGDRVEMTFLSAYPRGFARWFLMFGDEAEIVTPVNLRQAVRELAEKLLKNLK